DSNEFDQDEDEGGEEEEEFEEDPEEADEAEVEDHGAGPGDFDPGAVRGDWPAAYPFTKNGTDFKLRLRRRESEKITVVDLKQGQGAFAQLVQLPDNFTKDKYNLYGCENPKAASTEVAEKIAATKIKNDRLVLLAGADSQLPR
ncbi:unnamed protein product, partial [Prorocentrum cordatum]